MNNDNMFIGFPAYCKLSKKENEFRINLKNKMVSLGLIKEAKTSQECECISDNSKDSLKKYVDIITPVVESIENHINDINKKVEKSFKLFSTNSSKIFLSFIPYLLVP